MPCFIIVPALHHSFTLFAANKKPRIVASMAHTNKDHKSFCFMSTGSRNMRVRSDDSPAQKIAVLQELMRWNYFDSHFCKLDPGTRASLFQQLCGPCPSADVMAELKTAIATTAVSVSHPKHTRAKQCPKCRIDFSEKTERYYHCGKTSNPYDTYKCKRCQEEYSDLQRLRKQGNKNFKELRNDIALCPWVRQERTDKKSGKTVTCWVLEARGRKWTRCNDPACRALYKFSSGTRNYRTVAKHRRKMDKIGLMDQELRHV